MEWDLSFSVVKLHWAMDLEYQGEKELQPRRTLCRWKISKIVLGFHFNHETLGMVLRRQEIPRRHDPTVVRIP